MGSTGAPNIDFVQVASHTDRKDVAGHFDCDQLFHLVPDLAIGDLPISERRDAPGQGNLAPIVPRLQMERGAHERHPSLDSQGSATVAAAVALPDAIELRSPSARAAAIQAASGTCGGAERGRDVSRSVE